MSKIGDIMRKTEDLTGNSYGRLTVVRKDASKGKHYWFCDCSCGKTNIVRADILKERRTLSCGCYQKEFASKQHTKHGLRETPEYIAWNNMKNRCLNEHHQNYKDYGGRGISVCDRWYYFENFYEDMGKKPSRKHSIERMDNDKGYSSGNCKWALRSTQMNNTRRNRFITVFGKKCTIGEAASLYKIKYSKLYYRITHGWSEERAVSTL